MPDNGCPLVLSALRAVRKQAGDVDPFAVFQNTDWDAIEEDARLPVSDETVRLRAFYVLELLYAEILPRALETASSLGTRELWADARPLLRTQYKREAGDLAQLAEDLKRLHKRLSAHVTIAAITNTRATATMQRAAIFARADALIPTILEAVDILLGCLRRGDIQRISVLGERLLEVAIAALMPAHSIENELRIILTIYKENAITPWQRKNKNSPA
jgi:hypothetical protein